MMRLKAMFSRWTIVLFTLVLFVSTWQPVLGDDSNPPVENLPAPIANKEDAWLKRADERQISSAGAPVSPEAIIGPDKYGYLSDELVPLSWEVASIETPLKTDDEVFGPVNIGFSFPFYENSESQLYISSNGMLLFGDDDLSFNNRSIPFIGLPNRFIAPFWDDLNPNWANGGRIYYQESADKFIVIWSNVTRHGQTGLLTFEAILYADGKICYQYQALNGELNNATIGVEDPDGVDGLTYLFNDPNLINLLGKRLCFHRPSPQYAAKVMPTYQGHFTTEGKTDFSLAVRNIGNFGTDRFDITAQSENPSWSVVLFDANQRLLTDTDGNMKPDTGVIPAGSSVSIMARVIAPDGAEIGGNTRVTLSVASPHLPSQKRDVILQATVPTSFGQAVKNSETGIDLDLIWPHSQRATTLATLFTGSNLAIATLLDNGYMYLWERNGERWYGTDRTTFTDIEFALLSRAGMITRGATKLTTNFNNTTLSSQIYDSSPTLAVNSSGKVGITWKRDILVNSSGIISNIYFLLFDLANPTLIPEPINITGNSNYGTNAPIFGRPKIKSIDDETFAIAFEDKREQIVGEEIIPEENIAFAVYSTQTKTFNLSKITNSDPGKVLYREPGMARLRNNQAFVVYTEYDAGMKISKPSYQVFDDAGNKVGQGVVNQPNINGWLPTATELGNDRILLAWTQALGGANIYDTQIAYVLINEASYTPQSGFNILTIPDGRAADYVSVSIDGNGYGILTWIDVDLYQGLYYALINQDGSIRTPVISFNPVGLNSALVINDSGYSLASYMGSYLTYMPMAVKK